MSSAAASALRTRTAARRAAMAPSTRVRLALALGLAGLRAYCAAQDLTPREGRLRLRAQRRQGRRASACAGRP